MIDQADFNDESKLGTGKEMQDRLSRLVAIFDGLDFRANRAEGDDLLGDAYEFPASRDLCRLFNLEYGNTVGSYFQILQPKDKEVTPGYREIYATGNKVDKFVSLVQAKTVDLHAQLQFAEDDVKRVKAAFLGHSYYDHGDDGGDPNEVWIAPEGK